MSSKPLYGAFHKKKPKRARQIHNISASDGPIRDLHERMIFFVQKCRGGAHERGERIRGIGERDRDYASTNVSNPP
jgi:hypothetical protein